MNYEYHDGGRAAAGYKGDAGDCVTRAIAIASGLSYQTIYDLINAEAARERVTKRKKHARLRSARTGVYKSTRDRVLDALGWVWFPTMSIGSGCKVHLRADELPAGRLIVSVSKHLCAVVDGTVFDTHDPRRDGKRCVYGYWKHRDAMSGYEKHMRGVPG